MSQSVPRYRLMYRDSVSVTPHPATLFLDGSPTMCFVMNSEITSVLPENQGAANVWDRGAQRYDRISRQIADAIEHCIDRLQPKPGDRILDVATGTGWAARRLVERGCEVTAIDISSNAIDAARRLDTTQRIDFQVGDAEALAFSNAEFDGVISTFGVMFCGNPTRAASEIARVCKPGGRVALACWENHGGVYEMFRVIQSHQPALVKSSHSPFAWADENLQRKWLGQRFDLSFERATSFYREATSADAWTAFSEGYGSLMSVLNRLNPRQIESLRTDFVQFHEKWRTPAGILVRRPYVISTGRRNADV